MIRPLTLFAAFSFFMIVTMTIGIAQANSPLGPQTTTTPSNTPTFTVTSTPTQTSTPTFTPTETSTPTFTPTDPCYGQPAPPRLLRPRNKRTFSTTQITLRWERVECATNYRILVRIDSPSGDPVFRRSVKKLEKTVTLTRGHKYYWNIKACHLKRCNRSGTRWFKIDAPIPPTPRPTSPGSTPVPHGTPVPGTPPRNIAVYKGVGAYLNTDPDALFRFECGLDSNRWIQLGIGSTVYNIALWYYPNEGITYQRMDFNLAQIVETGSLAANGSGYVELAVDTSSWTPNHHYHLIFTGKNSQVSYCGHFDVTQFGGTEPLPPDSHSPYELERVYRQAGVQIPTTDKQNAP